ncbi:hypothetical protein [Nonomuraea sp. CA-141351]|uniref:hypothetical protein n=1 Tax=Nonomuraea sp. CA-141351 TaxID=3239996 RepID=UPI003D8EF22D
MILHEFLPRGQKTLIQLVRSAMVAHAMELVPLEDMPDDYTAITEAAKRAYQNGDNIVFNALVMAVLFQIGIDVEAGD